MQIKFLNKTDFVSYMDNYISVYDTKSKYQALAYTCNGKYAVVNISRYKDGTIKIAGSQTFTDSIIKLSLLND